MIHPERKIIVKYISFLMLISFLPLLAISLISYQASSRTIQHNESVFSHALLEVQKENLELQLDQVENLIANISSVEEITNVLDDADSEVDTYTSMATHARIGYILNGYLHLEGLVSIDIFTNGGAHYHVGDTLDIEFINDTSLNLIKREVLNSGRPTYWAGKVPNVNLSSNHPFVLSAARILTKTDGQSLINRPVAILLVNFSIQHIEHQFSKIDFGIDSSFALLDQHQRFIYIKNTDKQGNKIEEILKSLLAHGTVPAEISWNQQNYIVHNQKINDLGWQLFSITPEETLLKGVKTIRETTILLFLIGFLIIGVAVWYFTRNFVNPIQNVISGYKRLQYDPSNIDEKRLPVLSNDEIGELVNWFNSFLDNLVTQRQQEKALRDSESQFKALSEAGFEAVFISSNGVCIGLNLSAEKMFGYSRDEVIDKPSKNWIAIDEQASFQQYLESNTDDPIETLAIHRNGSCFPVEVRSKLSEYRNHNVRITAFIDISERKKVDEKLRKLSFAVESISSGIIITDLDGNIEYVNPKFCEITGYSVEQVIGKNPRFLKSGESEKSVYENLWQTITSGLSWKGEMQNVRKDGSLYWAHNSISGVKDSSGITTHFIAVQDDVTLQYELAEQLSFEVTHDTLTGLINRREFERRAERLLSSCNKAHDEHAVCFMDLDQFKIINDTCGHIAGDELLHQLGALLQGVVRQRDTLARLGGDEFGILMEHCSLEQAQRVTDDILNCVESFEFYWQEQRFRVGISIGLVSISDATPNLTELLKQADTACYMAKDSGRHRVHVYHFDNDEVSLRLGQMEWVSRINHALENNLFCLYAQPIVSLENHQEKHYELLIRMIGENGTVIPPRSFLPAADRYDLIDKIDSWVVQNAFAMLSAYPDFLDSTRSISINLSGRSLSNEDLLNLIILQLRISNIKASKICFEVTETEAISNLSAAIKFISTLKEIGCRFALDDFGSGLSSFGYLKNLPVDYIKIDGMFVKGMCGNPIDHAMVKSIHDVGQVMGVKTIAEFVENDDIKMKLKAIGVNFAQGYGLGVPQPLESFLTRKNTALSLVGNRGVKAGSV